MGKNKKKARKANNRKPKMASDLDKLFVYGIFLTEYMRMDYGMHNPKYATVRDFITTGVSGNTTNIVEAVHVPGAEVQLTGLYVDVDPKEWNSIDALEMGYERIKVNTSAGVAWMYAREGTGDQV